MKKFFKIFLGLILAIVALAFIGYSYLNFAFPKVKAAEVVKIDSSPEKIERGKYLANHVAVCIDCHSTRDWAFLTGPIVHGTEGKGGEIFPREFGFPGIFYAKNITPVKIGDWTDGELYRTITTGVTKNGSVIFPVMPYQNYGKMDPEDIKSIIAYIRTLKPIHNEVKKSEPDFPFSLILKTIPQEAAPGKRPEKRDTLNYGKYMFTMASCNNCHTRQEKGKDVPGMESAGGFEFPMPAGVVRSANITPDKITGIGNWTKELFVSKFKYYDSAAGTKIKVSQKGFNTPMPWAMYAGMTEEDLGAIFKYLQTIKPVNNEVIKFSPIK